MNMSWFKSFSTLVCISFFLQPSFAQAEASFGLFIDLNSHHHNTRISHKVHTGHQGYYDRKIYDRKNYVRKNYNHRPYGQAHHNYSHSPQKHSYNNHNNNRYYSNKRYYNQRFESRQEARAARRAERRARREYERAQRRVDRAERRAGRKYHRNHETTRVERFVPRQSVNGIKLKNKTSSRPAYEYKNNRRPIRLRERHL